MRFGSYVRLSRTEDDRTVSLDSQAEAIRKYVADKGGTIVLEARDIQSGLDAGRPGYRAVLEAAHDRHIDAVAIWRWDRFGRDAAEALRALKELSDLGVEVHSVTEPGDQFLHDLMLLLAGRESRVISARVKPVMTKQAREGRWQGQPPAGYELRDGKLAPNGQAPLIRELFERAATARYSMAALRTWVLTKGLTSSTGNAPCRSLVQKWLRNPAYMGDVVYNRRSCGRFEPNRIRPESEWIVVRDAHPAIVERTTFDTVQAILATHKRIQGGVRGTKWLLTGIAYCGHSGHKLYGRAAKRSHTYTCYAGAEFKSCKLRHTGGKTLDAWIKEQISGFQITPEIRQRAAEIIKTEAEQSRIETSRQRENLETAHKRHQETRSKLAHRVMADTIPPDVYRKMEEDEATAIKAIEAEMAKLEAPPPIPDLTPILDVLETVTWDALDDEAWREIVALLVERVDVFGLGDYRLTWSAVGRSLASVLEPIR